MPKTAKQRKQEKRDIKAILAKAVLREFERCEHKRTRAKLIRLYKILTGRTLS